MNKKYFFIVIVIIILLSLVVYNRRVIIGSFFDSTDSPIVNCNSELPIDELIQCVKYQYEVMDKIYMTSNQKEDRKWAKRYTEGKYRTSKRFYLPDTYENITYKTVPSFSSIKECYKNDRCQLNGILVGQSDRVSYDDYKGRGVAIKHYDAIQVYIVRPDKKCNYKTGVGRLKNCENIGISGVTTITYRHFTRSYRSDNKDIIFFEDNGMNIFMGSLEFVRLSDKKTLVGIRIFEFHPFNPAKDGFVLNGNVYEKESPGGGTESIHKFFTSECFSPYAAFTVWDIRDEDIQTISDSFALSLDKREKPSKLYINTGNKVYEVSIPKGKEN